MSEYDRRSSRTGEGRFSWVSLDNDALYSALEKFLLLGIAVVGVLMTVPTLLIPLRHWIDAVTLAFAAH